MVELTQKEIDHVKAAFDTISIGKDELDSTEVAVVFRGLNLNPSLATLKMLGVEDEPGKMISVEQFVAMYHRLMNDDKMETYEGDFNDFMLIMELYDIHQNGRALISELEMALLRLGEKLSQEEMDVIYDEMIGEVAEDGTFEYEPFLKRLTKI